MVIELPQTVLLTGVLRPDDVSSLTAYCGRLHRVGKKTLHLDMSGVTDCLRPALDGLLALARGSTELQVTIEGVRWSQFKILLSEVSRDDAAALYDAVRQLMEAETTATRARKTSPPTDEEPKTR